MKTYKVVVLDLETVLVKTASGKSVPEDVSDFRIQLDMLDRIIADFPSMERLWVISDQRQITTFDDIRKFSAKFRAILKFLEIYALDVDDVDGIYFDSNLYNHINEFNDPELNMISILTDTCYELDDVRYDKSDIVLIGGPNISEYADKCGIDFIEV